MALVTFDLGFDTQRVVIARVAAPTSRGHWAFDSRKTAHKAAVKLRSAASDGLAAAYGWPSDITDNEALRELLNLNGGGHQAED